MRLFSLCIFVFFSLNYANAQNVLVNPGFEQNPPSTFGNNIGHPFVGWTLVPGRRVQNIVKVDGPNGFNYGTSGPESDAIAPGAGIEQHYYDGTGDIGHAYQSFTIPTCGPNYTGDVIYTASGYFSSRDNTGASGEVRLREGVGVNGTLVSGPSLAVTFPGNQQWNFVSGDFALSQGTTYSYITFFGDFANFDEAYLAPTFGDGCPTTIDVTKTSSVSSIDQANISITYTIEVTNTGGIEATDVILTDPIATVTCPTSGTNTILLLSTGSSETCTATYTATQSDFDTRGGGNDQINNTVSVSATSAGVSIENNASENVNLIINPSINIEKSADLTSEASVGETINYKYTVTNNGNQTIFNVTLNDIHNASGPPPNPTNETLTNDVGTTGDSINSAANDGNWDVLAPGDEITFSGTYIVTQDDIDNLQ